MAPIQQMLIGVGAKKKTYMDDVFSTYAYTGSGSARSINNGVDLTKGGLVWTSIRNTAWGSILVDTERGATKHLHSYNNSAEDTDSYQVTAFNSNGYSLGTDQFAGLVNYNNTKTYASWTFRKAKGFFDVVTYTGNGNSGGRQIAHSLGCVPGMFMIKRTDASDDWETYHVSNGATSSILLNSTAAKFTTESRYANTAPTATHFTVGHNAGVNADGGTYVCYLFAGGESTAATARSVDFDETGDYLSTSSSSSDFTMGTGDFTIECWVKKTGSNTNNGVCHLSTTSGGLSTSNPANDIGIFQNQGVWKFWAAGATQVTTIKPVRGVWTHLALVRHNGKTTFYVNGVKGLTVTDTSNYDDTYIAIAGYYSTGNYLFDGKISNFRVVKGTAVYTSSFRPTYEPLTNITNTVLLCCNNSSTTGSTVTPVTINANGDPTASTDSPFDDPAGFVFGDSGDQNVIKCGSYIGNGSSTGPDINIGWEPQWLLIKRSSASEGWYLLDSIRGIVTGADDRYLTLNSTAADDGFDFGSLTPSGFKLETSNQLANADGSTYFYMAIRRPDGYVGKPADAGTDVFTTAVRSSSTAPRYISNFPVDFALYRNPSGTMDWFTTNRLTGPEVLKTNSTDNGSDNSDYANFDHNNGYSNQGGSGHQSWMWKRNAGFDVVAYKGDDRSGGRPISHNLSVTPEMMWIKVRDNSSQPWMVYHKDVGHGKDLKLNTNSDESNNIYYLNNTAPTSTHFTVGQADYVNGNYNYIAMLFASVDGISKVGSYTGSGSTQTITTGFQPRFVIIKNASNNSTGWYVLDTLRGWGSGNDKYVFLNNTDAQGDHNFGAPTSTGFTVENNFMGYNFNGSKYIYYAHA